MSLCLAKRSKAPHAGKHAQREHVELHKFQNVEVVLVPLDDLAVFHSCRFDGCEFIEPVAGEHEPARMPRESCGVRTN